MAEAHEHDLSVRHFLQLFGGWQGIIDSGLPVAVFLAVRAFTDLNTGLVAAVGAGLVVVALRKARGDSLQYALMGFAGLLVAVLLARATGSGKGFFLPGIVLTGLSGVAFALSAVLGQPAVAHVLVTIDEKYAQWRTNPALKRACVLATWVWAASFLIRCAVASAVALTVGDDVKDNAILFGVIQVERYSLLLGAVLYTIWVVRRAPLQPAG